MYRLKYRITACSPLIISKISGDMNMVNTEQYISGSVVLGLLANRFIHKEQERIKPGHAHEHDDFYSLFLNSKVKIGNAYIISQDEYGEYGNYPTPFSIEKEKYGLDTYDRLWRHQNSSERTEYPGNFCRIENDTVWVKSVQTNINFHHARDNKTGTAKKIREKGVIFNYESIDSNQIFEGNLVCDEKDLERLIQICDGKWQAFAGRSRNSQYGSVEFNIIDKKPHSVQNEIKWPKDDNDNPADLISMTLVSNLILYNENGFPSVEVDDLEKELKKRIGNIEIKKAFVKENEVENFVGIWQLKKPSETCFAAGSTFLLNIKSDNCAKLEEIQQNGIGERTHEGFGRCIFGIQNEPELFLRNETDAGELRKPVKPKFPIPEIARESITEIVKDIIIEKIELEAINKQEEFDHLPSNSLIGRLISISNSLNSRDDFVRSIKNFRLIASDQLKYCLCTQSNLSEFLIADEDADQWINFFRKPQNSEIKSLCDEIGFNPEKDKVFKHKAMSSYFNAFFSIMRKRANAEREVSDDK